MHRKNMTTTSTLIHTTGSMLPLLRGLYTVAALGALIMLFKPLLSGIVRALVLLVNPRLTKKELAARRQMRDALMVQQMIDRSHGPSHATELRAMAARS
jgi:hypothetical protein